MGSLYEWLDDLRAARVARDQVVARRLVNYEHFVQPSRHTAEDTLAEFT